MTPRRALPGLLALAALPARAAVPGETELPPGARLGGPFRLVDHTGRPVDDGLLAGRWSLLYFGYASCPDVCPTELQGMAAALEALPPDQAAKVLPVFVTVDPARDTPEALARFVALFHPRLVGLTGTPEQVAGAARAYRVYYRRVENEAGGAYLMDHSSILYLVGPDGLVRSIFRGGTTPEDLAAAIGRRLR